MIDSYRIHFPGIMVKNVNDGSIVVIGNILSTEVCVSNGILYSYRGTHSIFYPIYNISNGTMYYGALKEAKYFWKYFSLHKNGIDFFDHYTISDYRSFLIRDYL